MFSRKLTRSIAIGTAAIAVAIGAYTIVNPASSNGASGTANAATVAQPGQIRRLVRSPHDQDQLAAPRLLQQELQGHRPIG